MVKIMKVLGFDLSFLSNKTGLTGIELATIKLAEALEPAVNAPNIKALISEASGTIHKIELLNLYETAMTAKDCPLSPVLSNYVLDLCLNDADKGVRKAARDVIIKSLTHDLILPAWDANRDGQPEELTAVLIVCLEVAIDEKRDYDIRFDAFTVSERIIGRMPERATEPVQSLLTSLAVLKNHQLAERAKDLLHYIEDQTKDEPLRDSTTALKVLVNKLKNAAKHKAHSNQNAGQAV